jgi:hypothetical protein
LRVITQSSENVVSYNDRFLQCIKEEIIDSVINKIHYAFLFHALYKEEKEKKNYFEKKLIKGDDTTKNSDDLHFFEKFLLYANFLLKHLKYWKSIIKRQKLNKYSILGKPIITCYL